jgi:hypothetical protein
MFFKYFLKKIFDIKIFKYPFFILFGEISYRIKGHEQRKILNILKPGDLLLRRYNHYLGSLLIPGYFSHVAIYVGDDSVIHMLGKGIYKEDILTFTRCDDIVVFRWKLDQQHIGLNEIESDGNYSAKSLSIIRALQKLEDGIEYDYLFDFEDRKKFSCTEFVHYCYDYFKIETKFENYILPDDLLTCNKFQIIWKKRCNNVN